MMMQKATLPCTLCKYIFSVPPFSKTTLDGNIRTVKSSCLCPNDSCVFVQFGRDFFRRFLSIRIVVPTPLATLDAVHCCGKIYAWTGVLKGVPGIQVNSVRIPGV